MRNAFALVSFALLGACGGSEPDWGCLEESLELGYGEHAGAWLGRIAVYPEGQVWMGGGYGRMARWSQDRGFQELEAAGNGYSSSMIDQLFPAAGRVWAVNEERVRYFAGDRWIDSGLEAGETAGYGWGGMVSGLVEWDGELLALTALPPDTDHSYYGSDSYDHVLNRWTGQGWETTHGFTLEGGIRGLSVAGEHLVAHHYFGLYRWDGDSFLEIEHPLGADTQAVGFPTGEILSVDAYGDLALGTVEGLELLEGPVEEGVWLIHGRAGDDLVVGTEDALYHYDGQEWSPIPVSATGLRGLYMADDGTLYATATGSGNGLFIGDVEGLSAVWTESEPVDLEQLFAGPSGLWSVGTDSARFDDGRWLTLAQAGIGGVEDVQVLDQGVEGVAANKHFGIDAQGLLGETYLPQSTVGGIEYHGFARLDGGERLAVGMDYEEGTAAVALGQGGSWAGLDVTALPPDALLEHAVPAGDAWLVSGHVGFGDMLLARYDGAWDFERMDGGQDTQLWQAGQTTWLTWSSAGFTHAGTVSGIGVETIPDCPGDVQAWAAHPDLGLLALDGEGSVHHWDGMAWWPLWEETGATQLAAEPDGTVHLLGAEEHRWGVCP
jgi:hypothetical protein